MRKLIDVTEEDIKYGKRGISESCPIANALRRKFGGRPVVRITICFLSAAEAYRQLPTRASAFIHRFDLGKPVKPFKFYLDV